MAETTIEWTATVQPDGTSKPGYTFNPWIGCSKVHAGCANCYAERDWDRRRHIARWGQNGTRVLTSDENWAKPVRWNKAAQAAGVRAKVFCASLADVFEDWKGGRDCDGAMTCHTTKEELSVNRNGHIWPAGWPSMSDGDDWGIRTYTMADARQRLFSLIDATPHLDWLLLTKRPENILKMMERRKNVWLGTSISDQASADKQIPELLRCLHVSPVLFLSAEPLLGPVDLRRWLIVGEDGGWEYAGSPTGFINWVICGGESGHNARPMQADWARGLRDQCQAASVAFHFKQWGETAPIDQLPDEAHDACQHHMPSGMKDGDMVWVGKKAAGRMLDGREWNEFPV